METKAAIKYLENCIEDCKCDDDLCERCCAISTILSTNDALTHRVEKHRDELAKKEKLIRHMKHTIAKYQREAVAALSKEERKP